MGDFLEEEGARYTGCIVWLLEENKSAIGFYESLGFRIDGQEQDFVHDRKSFPEVRPTPP